MLPKPRLDGLGSQGFQQCPIIRLNAHIPRRERWRRKPDYIVAPVAFTDRNMPRISKMYHGEHVFCECAGAGHPRLFKRESECLLFGDLGGQAIPRKRRPQPPIHPRMSICGTLKGSIQYRQTHRCSYCIRNTQRRKGGLRTHDSLVKVEVRHDDSYT